MDKNIWQRFVVTFFNQPWRKPRGPSIRLAAVTTPRNRVFHPSLVLLLLPFSRRRTRKHEPGRKPRCTCVTARRHARTLDFSARNDRRVHFSRVILCNPENRVEPIARRITIRSSGLRARSTNRRVLRARLENKEGGKEKRGHGERHRNRRNGKITEEHCSSTVRHHTGTAAHRDG